MSSLGLRGSIFQGRKAKSPGELEAEQAATARAQYSDFSGGLASAVGGMVGSTKAYAASGLDALGATGLAKGLYDSAAIDARNAGNVAPEIATTDQITDFSTAGRYVLGKLGGAAGSLPPALLGGVAGRLAARSGLGAAVGAGAAYQPVMAGGHVQELNARPQTAGMDPTEKFLRGTVVGTGQAAVEGLGPAYLANRLFKRNAPATSVGGAARNFGTDVAKGAALEGGGAAVSDVIGQGGMMQADPMTEFDGRQTFEAGIGEAVGGAGFAVPGAAVANTLDYLNAGKDLAVGTTKNVTDATARSAPGVLNAAKGAAQNVMDAGAMFKNTAAGYLKHPELAKLVAAQSVPPELEGATSGEIEDWLASDSNDRRDAALKIAQRTLIDREASDNEKVIAQQLLDNPTDPESWKPFADGMILRHKQERLAGKAAAAASRMAGWVEGKVGKTKSNLEPTAQDAAYLGAMRPTLVRATGVKDDRALDDISLAVREFLLSDAARDEAGWERLPTELTEAFGESTPEVLAKAYDALRRQGLTRDIKTKQELTFYTPEVAKRVVSQQLKVRNAAADVMHNNLALEALPQMPARDSQEFLDIADGIRDYLQRGKKDDTVEQYIDTMFGPNKDDVLEAVAGMNTTVQSSLGKGPVDEASIGDKPVDGDSKLRAVDGETGSDAQTEQGEEYNSAISELNTDGGERYLFKGQKKQAFDSKDAFLDKNIDLARKGLPHAGRRLEYNKMISSDQLRLDRVGVMDYALETGDRTLRDKLEAKYPDLSEAQINQRFFVLKNEASEVDQGEAIDVDPEDLNIAQGKKGSWQARTRIDSKDGNKDVSTLSHGRLYLSGDGIKTPFVTSARTIIENMWGAKKRGAFDEKTSDKNGAADKMAMFASGLTSLMVAGGFSKIEVKTPDGEMFQVDSLDGLPEDFALWDSNDAGARLTVGDARAATSKDVRTEKKKDLAVVALPDEGELIYDTREDADAAVKHAEEAGETGLLVAEYGGKQWAVYGKPPESMGGAKIPQTSDEIIDFPNGKKAFFKTKGAAEGWLAEHGKEGQWVKSVGKKGWFAIVETLSVPDDIRERAKKNRGYQKETATTFIKQGDDPTALHMRPGEAKLRSELAALKEGIAKGIPSKPYTTEHQRRKVLHADALRVQTLEKQISQPHVDTRAMQYEQKAPRWKPADNISETEEMAAGKAKEYENTERRFDEETGLELQPRDKSLKGHANLLQQRVTKLRAEYKALAEQVAEYEAKEGKNAIREAALKRGHAKLAALVEQGKKLAAELAKLPPVEPKPTSTRAKEAAAELKRKEGAAATASFLQADSSTESTSTPATDAKAGKDIAYLEATIAAHHGEKTAAGAYEAAILPNHDALDTIAKAFGARVRGFKVTGDKAKYGFFSGVYQGGNRDVVYLSDAAKRPHMALLGHELVHQMKKTNPALYAKFEAAVSKHIKPEAYKAWSKMFPETGDKLREEFMAEVVSDGMMDRTFWEALAKKDVSIAKQVYTSVMRLFKQIMATVGYTPKTKSVLNDYAAVMKIAGEVMAEQGATSLRTMNESSVRDTTGAKFSAVGKTKNNLESAALSISEDRDGWALKDGAGQTIDIEHHLSDELTGLFKTREDAVKALADSGIPEAAKVDHRIQGVDYSDPRVARIQVIMGEMSDRPGYKREQELSEEFRALKKELKAEGKQFSLEDASGQTMTTEQKAEVSSYIEKTLGPKVMQFFTDQMKGSGEWSRDVNNQNAAIKIATTALNPLSVAHHEAMHEFFQRLLDGKYERAANVLRNAADSPLIKRQLQRHFAGQTEVLEQIENDVEERIAYMFQLWASGKLDIGTQTETVFRKIINIIRKTLGLVSQEKQLEEILQSFNDGKMAEPSAMAEVLDSQEARGKYLKKIGAKANPALKKANEWVGFAENALTGSKNPHLDAIGRTLNNKTGSKKDAQGFLSAKEQANNLYMNKFAAALRGIDPTGKDTSVATKADVDLALEGLQTKTWHKDPLVLRIQQQVEAVLDEMHGYMDTAGVKVFDPETKEWNSVRKVKDYRIPRSWDPAKIIEHSGKFKEMLFEHHTGALEKIAGQANAEIAAGKDAGDYTASWEKRTNGDKTAVTAEDVATAITNRLINSNGQNKLKESATAMGFSPFAKSVNEQTLWWIDEKVFAEFMEKDITKIISTYVGQITKRAEYSRRFGADGEVLQKAMDEALKWEIEQVKEDRPDTSDEDAKSEAVQNLEPARRAIMAMEGTLGHDISVLARKASAYTIVYQNVRLLGYALFANLIDPLGMMVRGAEFKDAYGAFKRGMRDVTREWGDLTGIRKAKDSDRDEAVRVAEMIGTVDSSGFMSQMGTIYSSQYLPEWAKNANDTFFRWNGLEAFNKSMRVGATQAAIGFIKRHYEKPNEHSERYFEELGLTRADVQLGPNGELNVENRQVQQAVMRWVDGAILRPNAAIRPTMSSDPHYAVFYHLKQFMYAMHAVILKRVQIEIKNGNTDPLILLMAGYVPMMLAADSAKGLIQEATGNGQPYWQHDSVGGVVAHGVERAGLLGVGQLLVDTVNYGPLGLLGPTVEQAADLVVQPLGDSVADATMVGPLSMALRGPESGSDEGA